MADTASPSTAGVHLSESHVPTDFLSPTPSKPSNLSVSLTLSPTAAASHHPPSTSSPASSAHLPTSHQVVTPTSKPLTLTSPPTPTATPNLTTPPSTTSLTHPTDLATLPPEDRFLPLAIDAHSAVLADELFRLLSELYLPFFCQPDSAVSSLSASSLIVTTITGGITNTLYRVTLRPELPLSVPAVLIRIFGPSTDQVIDRLTETRLVCELSRSRAGVRIYGHFTNGRLEEWLYATPLTPPTMTQYAAPIAATLATLHTQHVDWLADRPSPLYTTLPQWMTAASRLTWDDPTEADKRQLLATIDVSWWATELAHTLQLLKHSPWSNDALVFCHNDLLSGNILLQDRPTSTDSKGSNGSNSTSSGGSSNNSSSGSGGSGENVFLVDYEYSGNNYVAFDIANHFCECCGFECNWHQLPTHQQRLTFIRAYLTKRHALLQGHSSGTGNSNSSSYSSNSSSSSGSSSSSTSSSTSSSMIVVESEVVELECKVRAFLVLSHLWWGIWAIVQAKYSTIDFDYLQYSLLRKQGYLLMREESHRLLKESSTHNDKGNI